MSLTGTFNQKQKRLKHHCLSHAAYVQKPHKNAINRPFSNENAPKRNLRLEALDLALAVMIDTMHPYAPSRERLSARFIPSYT